MIKRVIKLFTITCVVVLFVSGISCAAQSNQPEAKKQIVTIQRGNLALSVSVDGNLVMPQAFDLRFGAPGNVEEVLVEEGDYVKAGTILARLDNSSQQLDIKSANCALQLTLSNLYETIPAIQQGFMGNASDLITNPQPPPEKIERYPQTPDNAGFPSYYPNSAALLSFGWAQDEVSKSYNLFQLNKYGEVVSELRIAVSDLESCIKIFQDAIESQRVGITAIASLDEISSWDPLWGVLEQAKKVVELIKQGQADLEKVQTLITQGKYAEAGSILADALSRMPDINLAVKSNVNSVKRRYDLSYPGNNVSLYFYRAAADKLNQALKLIENGKLNSAGYNENMRTARHYIGLCNSILGSNVMVLEHGLSLKNYQQYNVDLAKAAVTLENSKDNLLKTVIIAPFDGTVVSVGVKKNDILSAVDYSSKTAVQLVDTTAIKFQGLVDEIDILKIKTGQKTTITVDAVPGKVFTGTVTFISPYGTADTTSNVVKFPITIELDPSDVELKGGLTATADIAISSAANVVLVPITAVTGTPAGTFVTVMNEATGQSEKRQVTLGKQNQQFAEVVSGLKEDEKVVIEQKLTIRAPVITQPQRPPPQQGR